MSTDNALLVVMAIPASCTIVSITHSYVVTQQRPEARQSSTHCSPPCSLLHESTACIAYGQPRSWSNQWILCRTTPRTHGHVERRRHDAREMQAGRTVLSQVLTWAVSRLMHGSLRTADLTTMGMITFFVCTAEHALRLHCSMLDQNAAPRFIY